MLFLREVTTELENEKVEQYASFGFFDYLKLKINSIRLKGKTVVHISSSGNGGGVAELLKSQIPFERSLGIDSKWFVIDGAPESFFQITKKIHNFLQGKEGLLSENEISEYIGANRSLAGNLSLIFKNLNKIQLVIHDPQPMAIVDFLPKLENIILRLHIDLSSPNVMILEYLKKFALKYKRIIVSNKAFIPALKGFFDGRLRVIYPAIDPFTEKNREMEKEEAQRILGNFGINTQKPILCQVSRFDPWKDPLGVIESYRFAKKDFKELQLVLAGFAVAQDDPEAKEIFQKVKAEAEGDKDIFLFDNPAILENISNDTFINALYTASDIIIQKSIREGFGLTITEAMWKEKAVIAGNSVGAIAQIKDNIDGILVNSPEEAGIAIIKLLKDEKKRNSIGKSAKESVKKRFLLSRYILDHLVLYFNK